MLIDWAEADGELACGSKVRFDNLQAAGAKGVLLAGHDEEPGLGIAGNETLPGFRLAASAAKDLARTDHRGRSRRQAPDRASRQRSEVLPARGHRQAGSAEPHERPRFPRQLWLHQARHCGARFVHHLRGGGDR